MLACLAALVLVAAPADPRQSILDAMGVELARNQKSLTLKENSPPYFIAYQLKDYEQQELSARYGALFQDDTFRDRKLFVDVRVGSYQFDNSINDEADFSFSLKGNSYLPRKNGPIDNDPLALRIALWLVTDEKYKQALFNFLKRKGEDVYTVDDPKRPASFSKEKPESFIQPPVSQAFDRARWLKLARSLSARFNAYPQLFDSEVHIGANKVTRYFVSTEGARILTEETLFAVNVSAVTRADDGQLLDNSRDWYAPLESQLPSDQEIERATDKMISELLALRTAPAIDPYTGPAILEPEAAGVLFHEAIGHRLEGERQHNDTEGKTFRGQIGKPVLPSFISLVDDPTLPQLGGRPLNGHYLFDDQGVRGQRTVLVDKGVLRNYLLSRHPVEGFPSSNGHGRSQGNQKPIARMANLMVQSEKQVSDGELKRMLIAEARRQKKPYGLIIRDITGGNTNTSSFGYQAFKGIPRMVYRVDVNDGKETLVRGVEIVGTPLSSINRIMATGRRQGIFNGFCGAESGNVPVSASAPATLLQEIELQRALEGKDRPPLIESPAAQHKAGK